MLEIIRCYRQYVPAVRFIGIKYGISDTVNRSFGIKWREWMKANRFDSLMALCTTEYLAENEDGDAYIGLLRWKKDEPFEYWIGMFLPDGTVVPDGFAYHDFPAAVLGVCWVKGSRATIFFQEEKCDERLISDGMKIIADEQGAYWYFKRYTNSRFEKPDENGHVIVVICHFVAE